ncbi:PAS domain S-box protein [Mariprofundus ferrooxydans]|uniref:PAS domain S-box protein n=1 Tax=Mariprofundus ferrooxydans TaxID=314344 RepID=UPI00037DBF73|nr:PAS domain S-box protein [Mariprofundus ferrooxydans]
MLIADILSRQVSTVSPDMTMAAAAVMMAEKSTSCLVAVRDGKPEGILTEADLVRASSLQVDVDTTPVSMFISQPPVTINSNQNVYNIFDLLVDHHVRHLVVVGQNGLLEGVITLTDIIKSVSFDDYLKAKRVADEMSKAVVTIGPQSSVLDAMTTMSRCGISCIVINSPEGRAAGIFTERDAARMIAEHVDLESTSVGDVMSSPLNVLPLSASLLEASVAMREADIRRVVVVDAGGAAAGILTQFDVVRGLEAERIKKFRLLHEQMEEKLSESQQLLAVKSELERIVDASPAVLYRCEWCDEISGGDGGFVGTYVSASVFAMLGYERHECLEPGWWINHVHPDDVNRVKAAMQHLSENGELDHTYRFSNKAGEYLWIRDHCRKRHYGDGRADELIGSWLDITESHKSEQRVFESEQMYRNLIEQAFDAIVILDANAAIVFANQAAADLYGGTVTDLIGRPFFEVVYPDDLEHMQLYFGQQRISGSGPSESYEARLLGRDGLLAWAEVNGRQITWQGQPADLLTLRDITERKKAGQALRLTHFALDHAPDAVYWMEPDGRFVYVNETARTMLGYSQAELETMGVADIDPNFQNGIPAEMAQVTKNAKVPICIESEHRAKDGRIIPVEIMVAYIAFEGKEYHCSFVRDITERKLAQKHLDTERSSLQAMLNNVPFLAWLKNADGVYLAVNNNFAKAMSAPDASSLVGVSDFDIFSKDLAAAYRADDCEVMDSGESRQLEELAEFGGVRRWFETFKSPVFDEHEGVIGTAGMARDITERLQSEEQMRLLQSAVGSVNESIIITDSKGTIVYVNPAFVRSTGYTAEFALGKTPAILNSKQQSKSFYEQFWSTISQGNAWSGRILDRRSDGTIFPVYLSVAPIFDDQGVITHYVAVHEDLTQAEALQKKLMESQKMESVGTLAGGVAHDFNNLLAGLTGNLYLMRLNHKQDEDIVGRTREMEASMYRAGKMIQQMLTFARKDRPEMRDMDLCSFIKEAFKLAQASLPENITFTLNYPDNKHVWIHGDTTQLQQILLNLVVNARHAVDGIESGEIRITLSNDKPAKALLLEHAEVSSDEGWCCIRCSDNGCGIDSKDMEHVFDPFFTTREVGVGTGLGLAMVYGAVKNHRGIIDLHSEQGVGTTFSIYLPQRRAGEAHVIASGDLQVDGQGKGILLVDDESNLRGVLAAVFRRNGFTVWQAGDGEQAVSTYRKLRDRIALVLTDVVMPNMGGVAAAREIREMDADVPIVFQTGYGEDTQLEAATAITNSESLQKPVRLDELLRLIAQRTGCC